MFKGKSLKLNSALSLLASGVALAGSVFTPAVLARALSPADYAVYGVAFAFLPLLMILTQSLRNCSGPLIMQMLRDHDASLVIRSYFRSIVLISLLSFAIILALWLILYLKMPNYFEYSTVVFGMFAILVHVFGILISCLFAGFAASHQDFTPENLLKILPVLFYLIGIFFCLILDRQDRLRGVFLCFAGSAWLTAIFLTVKFRHETGAMKRHVFQAGTGWHRKFFGFEAGAMEALHGVFKSLAPVVWWNVAAYAATSSSLAILSTKDPQCVVLLSMALSISALLSGGLIAVSSPLAAHIASLHGSSLLERRSVFVRFNSCFLAYILFTTLLVLALPSETYNIWIGGSYGASVEAIVLLLLPSVAMRQMTMCFTLFVMGIGRQSTLWFSPLAEAVLAVGLGIALVGTYGVYGVVAALTFSAFVRLVLTASYDIKQTSDMLPISPLDLLFPSFKAIVGR